MPLNVQIIDGSSDLGAWDRLVESSPQGSIYALSWWLRSVCPGRFGVLLVHHDGDVVAGIPLPSPTGDVSVIGMPPLCQTLGVVAAPGRWQEDVSRGPGRIQAAILDSLPPFRSFSMQFHPNYRMWLPWYWQSFSQTTRYTCVLTVDEETPRPDKDHRYLLRKAQEAGVVLGGADDPDRVLELHRKTYQDKELHASASPSILRMLWQECSQRHCGEILVARDGAGRDHAGAMVVWWKERMYYLLGGSDPALRSSGAACATIWGALERARRVAREFDFEGSMDQGVHAFFDSFAPNAIPYFRITKSRPSRFGRLARALMGKRR